MRDKDTAMIVDNMSGLDIEPTSIAKDRSGTSVAAPMAMKCMDTIASDNMPAASETTFAPRERATTKASGAMIMAAAIAASTNGRSQTIAPANSIADMPVKCMQDTPAPNTMPAPTAP